MTAMLWLALVMWIGPTVDFGIKGGYQYANLHSDPLRETILSATIPVPEAGEWRDAFAVGVYSVSHLSDNFALEIELLYSRKGTRQDREIPLYVDPIDPDATEAFLAVGRITLSYLDIPLLLRTTPPAGGWFLLTGVTIGVPLDQKISLEENGVTLETDLEDVGRADVGLVAGVGVPVDWGEIELRYCHGLRNLDEPGLAQVRTRTWALMTGIRF